MAINATQIKVILDTGVYPENTLTEKNIFAFEQYVKRRRYPSCEIIAQQESTEETKRQTTTSYSFEIRVYLRNLGLADDENVTLDSIGTVITALFEAAVLQDHKIVLESKNWKDEQVQADGNHPAYLVSVLKIVVRQIGKSTAVPDGTLTFIKVDSDVVNPPAGNYSYVEVFDTEISEGYRTIEEIVNTKLPVPYAGGFSGAFVTNVWVQDTDFGSTSDKLNKMVALKSNGEKQVFAFQYVDKFTNESPSNITESVRVIIDTVQRLYRSADATIFRLIGKVMEPSTIS